MEVRTSFSSLAFSKTVVLALLLFASASLTVPLILTGASFVSSTNKLYVAGSLKTKYVTHVSPTIVRDDPAGLTVVDRYGRWVLICLLTISP